jgi:hypothetical protein
LHTHVPPGTRALALDEIYATNRQGAYLNVVDVHSGAVWATEGPLPVDSDTWTLLLWDLQERHLDWDRVVSDDGRPLLAAWQQVIPHSARQLDQWHVWQDCARAQTRLDRVVDRLSEQTPTVARQAARRAAGQAVRGRRPKSDLTAHAQELATATRAADGLRYLTAELRHLLDVVVIAHEQLLTPRERQQEIEALLSLMDEVAEGSTRTQQNEVVRLARKVRRQVPYLVTFEEQVAQVQADVAGVLAPGQQALLGWAWLRRRQLEWTSEQVVGAVPEEWRAAARVLIAAWEEAVRVSSAVERWHSILRPHISVRRRLTSGMLALVAVWYNHRVFTRGVHKGRSPLHLSGMTDAPTDWLVALGYPPVESSIPPLASLAQAA